MKFYARNLSMVGTHAALLAGFAFTILSQYTFKAPEGGVISVQAQLDLGMSVPCAVRHAVESGSGAACGDQGMAGWMWDTWLTQILQALYLLLTTLGM